MDVAFVEACSFGARYKLEGEERLGFISTFESGKSSWSGAYLVTDLRGNPVRFFKTSAPVVLDRLQEILLGKGIGRSVHCDLIAKSLVEKDRSPVLAILTDCPDVIHLRKLVEVPVGLFVNGDLQPHSSYPQDRAVLDTVATRLDLVDGPLEVFERLRQAIHDITEPGEPVS